MQKTGLKNAINWIVLIVYAVFTLVLVLHHEVWADEAQAWLVARDLNLVGMFQHVRTEGHPLLWYLLIMPLAKVFQGFNAVLSMQILNWALVVASVGFLIFKSPFNNFLKASIILSSGFLYWFPVIARSYCLIPILMFLIASFYKQRFEKPILYSVLIILLASTHVVMFGFCGVLGLVFAWEGFQQKSKKILFSGATILLSLLSVFLYIWGAQDENLVVKGADINHNLLYVCSEVVSNFSGIDNWFFTFFFVGFVFYCGYLFFKADKKMFLVCFAGFLSNLIIHYFFWVVLPQRAYVLILILIFGLWVLIEKSNLKLPKLLTVIFCFFLLASSFDGFKLAQKDYKYEFSGGKAVAKYVKENIPSDAFIIINYPLTQVSMNAYLPKDKWKVYYDGYKDYYTYAIWNKLFPPYVVQLPLLDLLREHKVVYVILSRGAFYVDIPAIYDSGEQVLREQERYRIYRLERIDG